MTESSSAPIPRLEAAKLMLDAWKFRQAHCWTSLQRYYLAGVLVSAIPYALTNDQRKLLEGWLWALPVIGGILGLAAVWHYGAEYMRCNPLGAAFTQLLVESNFDVRANIHTEPWWQLAFLAPKIGWSTVFIVGPITVCLAAINTYIVLGQQLP